MQLCKGDAHGGLECGFEGQQHAGAGVPVPSAADPATAAARRAILHSLGVRQGRLERVWSFAAKRRAPNCPNLRGAGYAVSVMMVRRADDRADDGLAEKADFCHEPLRGVNRAPHRMPQ